LTYMLAAFTAAAVGVWLAAVTVPNWVMMVAPEVVAMGTWGVSDTEQSAPPGAD